MSYNTLEDFLNLVTTEHRQKPKFIATLSAVIELPIRVKDLMLSMIEIFDVDTAVGDQLQIIGKWVGVSNQVAVPIEGVYFEWDGDANVGWDSGVWQGQFDPGTGLVTIPDDIYRRIIKGKIAANQWDGTVPNAYDVWDIAFPDIPMLMQDNQNMSMYMGFPGEPLDALTKALISQGYIPLKPEGVRVVYFFTTLDAPLFGWDMDTDEVAGWDEGTWGEVG